MELKKVIAALGMLFSAGTLVALSLACATTPMKPTSFVRTFDDSATWKSIEIRDDLVGKPDAWRMVVDTVALKYDLEVIEKDSGYLRTTWKFTSAGRPDTSSRSGGVVDNYRSRVVIKMDGTRARVKSESNWMGPTGWETGYDTVLQQEVYSDIQGKIGRVTR
jgi:hypothetical protein